MTKPSIAVSATHPAAKELAASLQLSVEEPDRQYDFLLQWQNDALVLKNCGQFREKPVKADFSDASPRPGSDLLLKAVGRGKAMPYVVDATAGLGGDSLALAARGCKVIMLERSAVVAALLKDALRRAEGNGLGMSLRETSAADYLNAVSDGTDVVYLDPMFPEKRKSALPNKSMRAFQSLIGADEDSDALLEPALNHARHRVVVKRPRKAPVLAGHEPSYSLSGKSVRFDIYALKAFDK